MIIPTMTIPAKIINNFDLTTFFNMIIEGSESAVTDIMNDSTVPMPTHLLKLTLPQ